MKKIKKIPIIFAGLTLLTGGMGRFLPVKALEDDENMGRDYLSLVKNGPNEYMKIDLIEYKKEEVRSVVSAPDEEGVYLKTAAIAYMNFDQGVTEAEADEALATLTGEKDDTWKVVSLYKFIPQMEMKTRNMILNQSTRVMNAYTNKSDILYYAVELGKTDGEDWTETWWVRGKVDYRSCVHSTVFNEDTMSCKRVESEGEVGYIPQVNATKELVYPPENEQVKTWHDEWKDLIQANCEAVQSEVELMTNYFYDGLAVLDRDDKILDGVLKSLVNYSLTEDKIMWLKQSATTWKARIVELRKFFDKTEESEGADSSKVEILEKENEALRTENTVLGAKNADLKRENDLLQAEMRALQGENERLAGVIAELQQGKDRLSEEKVAIEKENAELKEQIARLMMENEQNKAEENEPERCESKVEVIEKVIEVQKVEAKTDVEESKVEVVEEKTTEQEVKTEESEAEVPLLGEEEVKTSGFWWWLIPVVGAIGVAILAMRRKISRE